MAQSHVEICYMLVQKLEKSIEIILKIVQICGQYVWEGVVIAFSRPF